MKEINHKQYLIAIYLFLCKIYDKEDDMYIDLVSDLNPIYDDRSPADPAMKEDWENLLSGNTIISESEAYNYCVKFIKNYFGINESSLLNIGNHTLNNYSKDSIELIALWNESIKESAKYEIKY